MNTLFRLYFSPKCPHCIQCVTKCQQAALPVQLVDVTNDPVAVAGLKSLLGIDEVPILINFMKTPTEVMRGNNEAKLAEYINDYRRIAGGTATH